MNLDDEFVFPPNHFRYNTFNNYIKAMAKDFGLEPSKYSSHSLRTTCATDLYKKTHDIFLVQRVLHHTTPEMTQKYIKDLDMDEELRRVMLGKIRMRPRLKEIDGILRNIAEHFSKKRTLQKTLNFQHSWRVNPEATTGFEGQRHLRKHYKIKENRKPGRRGGHIGRHKYC